MSSAAEVAEMPVRAPAPEVEEVRTAPRRDPITILGIETSCDETSAAVLAGERNLLANFISSQASLHDRFGGIVPELASREHVKAINPALDEAMQSAGITFWDLSAVAVTVGPGLIGSLVVGVAAAKALAAVLEVPLVAVNHLEAHLYANFLEHSKARPPAVGLIVSGGHTLLVRMMDHGIYEPVGETLDDAAGEAFDKIARFLDLGFPGGPAIDRLSREGDPAAIKFPRPMLDSGYDFSFSGLKTAVLDYVRKADAAGKSPRIEDLCASFQEAVAEVLVTKTVRAAVEFGIPTVLLAGGVAANGRLRKLMAQACEAHGLEFYYPSPALCTDNAAMVAACGFHRYRRGIRSGMDLNAEPNLSLT